MKLSLATKIEQAFSEEISIDDEINLSIQFIDARNEFAENN